MAFPTNPIYKFSKSIIDEENTSIIKFCGGDRFLNIPFEEDNTDYQEYLEWVAEGNTAEAAD